MKKFAKIYLNNPYIYIVVIFALCFFTFCGCTDEEILKSGTEIKAGIPLMTIHYIDVGQGDCTFIELPNNESMLIDAGNPENADEIISYIQGLGYLDIDYIVATHPHSDHIGAMADVVTKFGVHEFYLPDVSHTSRVFENMVDTIYERNIPTIKATSGVKILNEDDLKIELLAPVSNNYSDLNEYSAVVKITYDKNSFLFMGDSGHLSENEIMSSNADIRANILKCGHHGSSTSSCEEFVKKVSPEYAVISCGVGNSYGHPHVETISLLESINAKILRTDTDGTIVAVSDGENIAFEQAKSPQKENAPPNGEANSVMQEDYNDYESNESSYTVYITKTGKKYHRDGCNSLRYTKILLFKCSL